MIKNRMNSFRSYLFHTWCFRQQILIALSYKNKKYKYLPYFDRKRGPSVTEQSEDPMDTVASSFYILYCLLQ